MLKIKLFFLFFLIFLLVLFFHFDLTQYMDPEFFIAKKQKFDSLYEDSPVLFVLTFFAFYVFCATFSIPGAALLTLISGFLFDFFIGILVVSLGSTTGATFAFLISRFFLKNLIQKKFQSRLQTINRGLKKDGAFYLFSLRLIPILPFFAVNFFMGVTPISVREFFVASFLGMLPGTLVYVNAGSQLSDIKSLTDIFSPLVILSFVVLACLPWIMKFLLKTFPLKKSAKLNRISILKKQQ